MRGGQGKAVAITPACVLTPATDEGPYFVDERLLRSDIRNDPPDGPMQDGALLSLSLEVVDVDDRCNPVTGAHVDIWHCNADGVYSDEAAEGTLGQKFLRGCQRTDEQGWVTFTTIVPGWYAGRSVHIHFKIRLFSEQHQTHELTSQLFFSDALIRDIHTSRDPYRSRGVPELTNEDDPIFGDDGWKLVLPVVAEDDGAFSARMTIGLAGVN